MGLQIDSEGIEKEVIPNVKNSNTYLKNAKSKLDSIDIPDDFSYKSNIKTCSGDIEEIKNDVKAAQTTLENIIDKFEKVNKDNAAIINSLGSSVSTYLTGGSNSTSTNTDSEKGHYNSYLGGYIKVSDENMQKELEARDGVVASVGNGVMAFGKGIAKFCESTTDFTAIALSTAATVVTYPTDCIFGTSYTSNMWKGTMSYVAEDVTGNTFNNFYRNTSVGKWLDKKAFKPFKSDGVAYQTVESIGEMVPIIAISTLSGGLLSPPLVAGITAVGKYTGEYWRNARDSAKPGEEWRTFDNGIKGLVYGEANGLWEGAQWAVGWKLAKAKLTGNKVVNSAIRVGIDTVFNAGDTPFRAWVDSLTTDKSFAEAFEERGGWTSVKVSTAVGLIGSLGGEVNDFVKIKNTNKKLKNVLENLDFNKKNLVEGIIDTIPKELDDLSKMRMIYLKLNQSVSYSDAYYAMSLNKPLYHKEMSEIFNKSFDIRNMETNSIICSNWSEIYRDLLEKAGIEPSKIKICGIGHKYVTVDLGKGKILIADGTQNIGELTDITNSKFGQSTDGYIITTQKELDDVNKKWTDMYRSKGIAIRKERIKQESRQNTKENR